MSSDKYIFGGSITNQYLFESHKWKPIPSTENRSSINIIKCEICDMMAYENISDHTYIMFANKKTHESILHTCGEIIIKNIL